MPLPSVTMVLTTQAFGQSSLLILAHRGLQVFSGRGFVTSTARLYASDNQLSANPALYTIWGANTGVGKTLASVGLAAAARKLEVPLLYVKPVQTGFPQDSDARLVAAASATPLELGPHAAHLSPTVPGSVPASKDAVCKVLYAWSAAVSPHLAAANEGRMVPDKDIVSSVIAEVQHFTRSMKTSRNKKTTLGLVETAGGVASPSPAGTIMCDVLRPLRLPAILVGDPKLGGISSTISAYESLVLRGYDVEAILFMDPRDPPDSVPSVSNQIKQLLSSQFTNQHQTSFSSGIQSLRNADAVKAHLANSSIHRLGQPPVMVLSLPGCLPPPEASSSSLSQSQSSALSSSHPGLDILDDSIKAWLSMSQPQWMEVVQQLLVRHQQRLATLQTSRDRAMSTLWWPFTQHAALKHQAVQVIDSRCGEEIMSLQTPQSTPDSPTSSSQAHDSSFVPLFDACASWWTQAVSSQLQPELSRSVAYAAGRYLHVISPQVTNQLSLEAAEKLIKTVGGSWATRVFFSDDGSTAIEVALKMAFRKYLEGLQGQDKISSTTHVPELKVVGLENAYHGDTLGAMDCVAPSVFNAPSQAPWYRGRGLFFDPPYIAMSKGSYKVSSVPNWLRDQDLVQRSAWNDLDAVLSPARDDSSLTKVYREYIEGKLEEASKQVDANGNATHLATLIIEPLVQGAGGMLMVDPQFQRELVKACRARGMPVIFDEVMTGLYRLGSVTAARLLRLEPDIACYAKLMTAGLVPMAATLATESVFKSFEGDSKLQALLHGHSYTAYPVGCATTIAAVDILTSPRHNANLCSPHGDCPTCPTPHQCRTDPCHKLRPMWDASRVSDLSHHALIDHVISTGTVFAAKLSSTAVHSSSSNDSSTPTTGYGSASSVEVVTKLRDEHQIYARPLGDVVYLMVTPTTDKRTCDRLLDSLKAVLDSCMTTPKTGQAESDGCVV